MIKSGPKQLLTVAVLLTAVTGCAQSTKPVKTPDDRTATSQGREDGSQDQTVNPISTEDLVGKDAALIDATYNIDVTSLFGINVCKGEIDIKFNAGFGKEASAQMFEIPKGAIDCGLVGKINLAEVLGAFSTQDQPIEDPVVIKDGIINLKQLGTGTYNPPRPMLPNFIATKKDKLASLNRSAAVTVTSAKEGKTASGTIVVRTIGVDQSYKPERMQRNFSKVLDFEVLNSGFQGVDKFSNMLFNRMAFKISLDPIAILHIEFKGKVSDAMKAAQANPGATGSSGGGVGDLASGPIIGALTQLIDVNIKMDLVKMKGIKDENISEEESTDDLGEEIGGKSSDD